MEAAPIAQLDDAQCPGPRDRSALEGAVLQSLRVIFRANQAHSRWVERQCGVSAAQLWALWELSLHPGMRVSELSKALALHRSTTSNLLDKLEDKALIRRQRKGPDQRVVQLYLTEAGRQLVDTAPSPAQGALSAAMASLDENDLQALQRGLNHLVQAIDSTSARGDMHPPPEVCPILDESDRLLKP